MQDPVFTSATFTLRSLWFVLALSQLLLSSRVAGIGAAVAFPEDAAVPFAAGTTVPFIAVAAVPKIPQSNNEIIFREKINGAQFFFRLVLV